MSINLQNMKLAFLVSLFLISHNALAQSCKRSSDNLSAIGATTCSTDSLEMMDKLKGQGFRCEEPSANTVKRGVLCTGKVGVYSQPVRIYVSPNYQKKSQPQINMFFHGHRLGGINTFQVDASSTQGHGDFGARLVESKSTDLLVIPESSGNCANYDRELNDASKMKSFISSLEQTTGLANANYKLAAHSGGGRILNKTLLNGSLDGRVKSVALFDSIYEEQAGVKKYLSASKANKVTVTYLKNASTQKMTTVFTSTTPDYKAQLSVIPISQTQSTHMAIMNQGTFADFLAN